MINNVIGIQKMKEHQDILELLEEVGFNFGFIEWISGQISAGKKNKYSEKGNYTCKAYLARSRVCWDRSELTSLKRTDHVNWGKVENKAQLVKWQKIMHDL